MHFTRREFTAYLLHCQPSLTHDEAEVKTMKFLRYVAKKRQVRDSKVVIREDVVPVRDTNISWVGKTPEELKEIAKTLLT